MRSAMFTMGSLSAVTRSRGWHNVRTSETFGALFDIGIMLAVGAVFLAVLVAVLTFPLVALTASPVAVLAGLARCIFTSHGTDDV